MLRKLPIPLPSEPDTSKLMARCRVVLETGACSTKHKRKNPVFGSPDYSSALCVQVRMAAGGALAIVHERISEEEDGEEADYLELVLPRLEQLSRDSQKFRAKRDRKLQRATFRDILKYFEVSF